MKKSYILLFISILFLTPGCKKEKAPDENPPATTDPYASLKQQIKETYAAIAFAVYEDSYNDAMQLKTAIDTFVNNPTAAHLTAAQQAWLDARESYGQSEVFRFADGPIDDGVGPEPLINSWPLDESYIDYVQGNPAAGIINNTGTYPSINASTLILANQSGSEENVSMGYHAIEFLLWGQDLSASTAGVRSYLDYVPGGGTASNEIRRQQYLSICADYLVQALGVVKDAWDPAQAGNYRSDFLSMNNAQALRNMLYSMAYLSKNELAGERMYVAYSNMNQEDEHSCFSDNTHRDIHLNYQGVANLYNGAYLRTDGVTLVTGPALKDLFAQVNATHNSELNTLLSDSDALINQIYIPFDQAIVLPAERPHVLDAVTNLQAQGDKIVQIAADLGILITL